jgi:prophage regulatory protein
MTETLLPETDRLISLEEVKAQTNRGKTMIYRMMRAGTFPKRCPAGWSEREVQRWVREQLANRLAA